MSARDDDRAAPRLARHHWLLRGGACVLILASPAVAATGRGEPSWTISGADCEYLVQDHEQVEAAGRHSRAAEFLRVRAGTGTYIHLQHTVDRSRIIDDLVASVWIRSDRKGLQIYGRVVLPHMRDPATGQPTTVRLAGESYDTPGSWQRLTIAQAPALLKKQLPVLRAKLRHPVDARGAYLDALVVNVFGGPGTTHVWFDEIELRGSVHVESDEPRVTPVKQERPTNGAGPRLMVSKLTVDGRPFFPRIINHHGESFELLKQLGFNSIYLPQLPTQQQQNEALRLGLWLICPPPEQLDSQAAYPSVIAWHLGDDISGELGVRRQVEWLRRNDPRARLVVAGAAERQWTASRQVDVLLRTRLPLGTSFPLSQFDEWLCQTTRLVRPGTPFWSSIQTELPATLLQQTRLLSSEPLAVSQRVEMEQIRQLCLAAVSSGSRGLWFRTSMRLDSDDQESERTRHVLERLNIELALLAPWVMGGQRVGGVPSNNSSRQVVTLATERSRLLVTTSTAKDGQFVGSIPHGNDTIVVAGVPDSIDVYLLTPIGLRPVRHRRISGGIQIELDENSADSMILMTEDPLVVTHVNRFMKQTRTRAAILEYQIARDELQDLDQVLGESVKQDHRRDLEEAEASLQVCQRLLESGDVTDVYRFARQAAQATSRVRLRVWKKAISDQPHPLSHPAGGAVHLIRHMAKIRFDEQAPEPWPGGDCEDLARMIQLGWRQYQTAPDDVQTYIALSPNQPRSGKHCLRIRVKAISEQAAASIVEAPPVWVNSAPVTVYPGQQIRITGWIRIDQPIRGSTDGLVVRDSLGGPALAQRFHRTKGWQRFEMIRSADQPDHLTLTFALSGLGEVWLDDLQITKLLDKRRLVSQN